MQAALLYLLSKLQRHLKKNTPEQKLSLKRRAAEPAHEKYQI